MSVPGMGDWLQAAAIIGATIVSEDATCIATGLLIRARQLDWVVGLAACCTGIFCGDLALWLAGRVFGRRVLAWRCIRARLSEARVEQVARWFDERGWSAVLAARFLPGTRLPVYLAAGILGRRARRFALWALLAALLWTPLVVLAVALLGDAVLAPLRRILGNGWIVIGVAVVAIWIALRVLPRCATRMGRAQLWSSLSRVWRWEFWPAWLFYVPLLPWIAYLAVRHRGILTLTTANPGIVPHGGIVGESKFEILSRLPQDWIIPSTRIEPGPVGDRVAGLQRVAAERGWRFPLILKPDAGQRGAGLRRVQDWAAVERYLQEHPQAALAQVYHAGPFEAGIFYYRRPDEPTGRIFSITDKRFPVLIGDGASTVEQLIWSHPRYRMQARTFLPRQGGASKRVLRDGETLPLTIAGNHCQGTEFCDGARLRTAALEATIDAIARKFDGFNFGRFDVRYADPADFNVGRGFSIVELNGVTSESTNIYDPSNSIFWAYRVLMRQWSLLFEIGALNRRLGHAPSRLGAVLQDLRAYYRARSPDLTSD